ITIQGCVPDFLGPDAAPLPGLSSHVPLHLLPGGTVRCPARMIFLHIHRSPWDAEKNLENRFGLSRLLGHRKKAGHG
ncbi:MAG TPA: hypothetical protein VFA87_07135, partial [Rhizomicrobium sp.]|nr:hypothetical protein [Rhizomicrobium sp.]